MLPVETPAAAAELQSEIERRCACAATLIQTLPVRARLGLNHTLDVDVHVFELVGCARTRTAYAWTDGGRVFTALDIGPIRSPSDAVCAALADDTRRNLERSQD